MRNVNRNRRQNPWYDEFGQRVKAAMERRGLKQIQLADVLKVSRGTVSRWIDGQTPDPPDLVRLSRVLEVPTAYLLGEVPLGGTSPAAASVPDGFLPVPRRAAQIGAGPGYVDPLDEPKHYAFTEDWLKRMGFTNPTKDPGRLGVFKVATTYGDSMEPTIRPGAVLLADLGAAGEGHRRAQDGRIYVVRDDSGGLQVKRVRQPKRSDELIIWGDNARVAPPEAWPLKGRDVRAVLVGEVRWVGQEVA